MRPGPGPGQATTPSPANDPDASWGHAKRNAPGAKDHLFFGYYAQVATMVHDEGRPRRPRVRPPHRLCAPPRDDPAAVMADTLVRAAELGACCSATCWPIAGTPTATRDLRRARCGRPVPVS